MNHESAAYARACSGWSNRKNQHEGFVLGRQPGCELGQTFQSRIGQGFPLSHFVQNEPVTFEKGM